MNYVQFRALTIDQLPSILPLFPYFLTQRRKKEEGVIKTKVATSVRY